MIVGIIFARGGSKGIPRKNIKLLAGKPLIAYAIETAQAVPQIDRIVVSTDDAEIADVARRYGAEVPFMRPPELAQDNSPEWPSWKHALDMLGGEAMVEAMISLPTTAPLRAPEDVENCITLLRESDADLVITMSPAHRSPYFNMVKLDDAGYASIVIPPEVTFAGRQAAPKVYDMTTVAYAARSAHIRQANHAFEGKVRAVIVPTERALDIDTPFDFQIAEFLMSQGKA